MNRLSEVFRMEEHKQTRGLEVVPGQPCVNMQNASYAWGFRIDDNQATMRKSNKAKL